MNVPESSPSLFHDAHQGSSPGNESRNTPGGADLDSVPDENTPIRQRRLFVEADTRESDKNNEDDDDDDNDHNTSATAILRRRHNHSQELDMNLVQKEAEEDGDDGDSTCLAFEVDELSSSLLESTSAIRDEEEDNEKFCDIPENMVEIKRGLGPEVKVSQPPADWVPDRVKVESAEPEFFVEIDNPGQWGPYTFRPKFHQKAKGKDVKKGQYSHHALPTGARPVPANGEGKRQKAGWDFHYTGWKATAASPFRSGATYEEPFPVARKGNLDYVLLKHMGLTKTRLVKHDAFFFWQLLFPVCDPAKSGITNDPWLPFYSKVERWSQKYAASQGIGGSYGHQCKPIMADELIHFDMAVVRDGVLGGMDGAIYRRWSKGTSCYDPETASAINHTRWLQVKRAYKLCDNDLAPKKGDADYDPAYKFDYIYKCLIHNINEFTQLGDLDLCGDETTCGHGGYGEAGSGILARRMNKPGITFGMQTVLVSDVHRNRPRAYTHRHKIWKAPEKEWTKQGPCEVRRIVEQLEKMVIGAPTSSSNTRQIFTENPHSTWDNHFSGDLVMDYLGEKGFPATMTCQRNRLPKGVDDCFLHKEKTVPKDPVARVARFNHPITLVTTKTKPGQMPVNAPQGPTENVQPTDITWTRVHVSFQSTSSTNISTVNALNGNSLTVRTKERGRANQKVKWAIEMNEARQLYLASYGRIDTIDSLIKNCNMFYVSWKYWHASKLHVQTLGLVVAYDMYKEVVEEGFAEFGFDSKEEAVKKCMLDFHDFRDQLAMQGLRYNPEDKRYKGDDMMRANTKKRKASLKEGGKRGAGRPRKAVTPDGDSDSDVAMTGAQMATLAQLKRQKRPDGRLCGNLDKYLLHRQNMETMKYKLTCKYCGQFCYTRCKICKLAAHDNPQRGDNIGYECFLKLHNDQCFGLAVVDCKEFGVDNKQWTMPTADEEETNSRHTDDIQRKIRYGLCGRAPTIEDSS